MYGLSTPISNHSARSSFKIDGANGRKLSLYLTFRFKFFCISDDLASPKIDLLPNALGPNSARPFAIPTILFVFNSFNLSSAESNFAESCSSETPPVQETTR